MAGWTSSVPGAVDGLLELLRSAPSLSGVTVLDGPTVTADPILEAVTVGFEDPETAAAVTATSAPEGLSRARDLETFTIACAAEVLVSASTDLRVARLRGYELLGFVGQILADHHQLNGAVMMAHLGAHTLSQEQTQQGALVRIAFSVDCEAYSQA
jgi:hypothetical protein